MTLATDFDRLMGNYYTDAAHFDAANNWLPDSSGMGFNWPLVSALGAPTFTTRGGMPCLDLFPQGGANPPPFFQMPWTGYVDCTVIMAIRNKGTTPTTRPVLHCALNDYLGEDYAGTLSRGDLSGSGIQMKTAVAWATTGALPANTYANGASGVGATLTGNANGALPNQDTSVVPVAAQRGMVRNEAAPANNGIYVVTQVGDAGTPYILTRATDLDASAEFSGATVKISGGTSLANQYWQLIPVTTHNVGTDAVTWREVTAEFNQYDDAGLYVSIARVPTLTGWNANGTIAGTALVDDAWTILTGIWSADGWRRIRTNLAAWAGSQSVASHRGMVGGGRLRMGWMQSNSGPITGVGEYCSIGEIAIVSDNLFVNQTATLDAFVTSLKTKYGIP